MSISSPSPLINQNGQAQQGTTGTKIANSSATSLSSNEFLNLMMDELKNQDPLNPSSSDPTQYLTQLAQMTSVEQQTATAQNTMNAAQSQAVSQAIGLIGDAVTYVDPLSHSKATGTVDSVQITSSGPSITVSGTTGVMLSSIINVTAQGATGSASGTTGSTTGTTGASTGTVA